MCSRAWLWHRWRFAVVMHPVVEFALWVAVGLMDDTVDLQRRSPLSSCLQRRPGAHHRSMTGVLPVAHAIDIVLPQS